MSKLQSSRNAHSLSCAEHIRLQRLAGTGSGGPSAQLVHEIAAAICGCCGHTPLKSFRLARGWTVDQAIVKVGELWDRLGIKRRGLAERSWREWEAGAHPDREYQDLLCQLFHTGPVQLGFATDYGSASRLIPQAAMQKWAMAARAVDETDVVAVAAQRPASALRKRR